MAKQKPIRLLLTITPDKLPEWYACLQSIDSGFVRAEMVRKALKKMRPAQVPLMSDVFVIKGEADHAAQAGQTVVQPTLPNQETDPFIDNASAGSIEPTMSTFHTDRHAETVSSSAASAVQSSEQGTTGAPAGSMAARIIQGGTGRTWT